MEFLDYYPVYYIMSVKDNEKNFKNCLNDYPLLSNIPSLIIANYDSWFGLWTKNIVSVAIEIECVNKVTDWIAWLQTRAIYAQEYLTRQQGFTGVSETLTKFVDTPETSSDYTGDAHTTNVTKASTSQDNIASLNALRPIIETIIHDFRKVWLLPQETDTLLPNDD